MKKSQLLALSGCLALATASTLVSCKQEESCNITCSQTDQQIAARAAVFPALAQIPADVEYFHAASDLRSLMSKFEKTPMSTELGLSAMGISAQLPISSIAIGGGAGSADFLTAINSLLSIIQNADYLTMLLDNSPAISQQIIDEYQSKVATALLANLQIPKIPSLYIAIENHPGSEAQLDEFEKAIQKHFNDFTSEGIEIAEINGYKGILAKGKLLSELVTKQYADLDDDQMAKLQQLLPLMEKHNLYLLYKRDGLKLNIVLCEDTEKMAFASSPKQSILASSKAAFMDSKLANNLAFCSFVDEKVNLLFHSPKELKNSAVFFANLFGEFIAAQPENKEIYEKAATSLLKITETIVTVLPESKGDASTLIWHDSNLHMEADIGIANYSYKPGKVKLQSAAQSPNTIAYYETTGVNTPSVNLDAFELFYSALDVANAVAHITDNDWSEQLNELSDLQKKFEKEDLLAIEAYKNTTNGLGLPKGLIIAKASMPPVPITATFFSAVQDRKMLAKGWDGLFDAIKSTMVKFNQNPEQMLQAFPITSAQRGDAATHQLQMAMGPAIMPIATVQVSNSFFTLSSDELTGDKIHQTYSSSAGVEFQGEAFQLNIAPLLDLGLVDDEDISNTLKHIKSIKMSSEQVGERIKVRASLIMN